MLSRVRIVVDALGDHLSEPRLLGKPLTPEAGDGMPTDLDGPGLVVSDWFPRGDSIGLRAQPGEVDKLELPLQEAIFPAGFK